MNFQITDLSKAYQQLEEKETIIYKLTGYTLDNIIEMLARGYEFTKPKPTAYSLEDLAKETTEKENEMEDNEIIKSLEICANDGDCKECKINQHHGNYGYCTSLAIKVALDLINRQKAEIDDLKRDTIPKLQYGLERANKYGVEADKEIEKLKAEIESFSDIGKMYSEIKAEAIKDFAERLKEKADYYYLGNIEQLAYRITAKDVDKLEKEMVGDN